MVCSSKPEPTASESNMFPPIVGCGAVIVAVAPPIASLRPSLITIFSNAVWSATCSLPSGLHSGIPPFMVWVVSRVKSQYSPTTGGRSCSPVPSVMLSNTWVSIVGCGTDIKVFKVTSHGSKPLGSTSIPSPVPKLICVKWVLLPMPSWPHLVSSV